MKTDSTNGSYNHVVDCFLKFIAAVAVFLPVNVDCPLFFQTVLVLLYVAVLVLITRKNIHMDWLSDELQPTLTRFRFHSHLATSWLFFGFYLLCAMLGFLEWRQPFYFTQDDSHSQFLPVIVNGMRGFFSEGVLPTWNAYLNLGHQTASVGVYTFTYPFTYILYFIARFLLGNELLYIEIFAWFHFMVGYFILYAALRTAGVRPVIAVAGSLCFVLSGFNLIAGRSWYIALAYTAWLPALAWSVAAFERSPVISSRWVWYTGLAVGLSFHAGHAQLWFYGVLFWGISIVWLIYCRSDRRLHCFISTCSAGFLALAIAAPLLIVQGAELLGGSITNKQWNHGIGYGLNNVLLPFPLNNSPHPNPDWGIHPDYMGALYYSCSVFFILFMIKCVCEVVYIIRRHATSKPFALATLAFSIPLVIAFWWSLGAQGRLWSWLAHIPPMNNMNSPFKFLPFIALYSIMVSGPFLERLIKRFDISQYSQCAIAALAIGLISINAIAGKYPWMDFGDRPYPELPEIMKRLQIPEGFTDKAVRILPYSPWRSQTLNYTITLPHNYPSYYRILSTDGYNLAVTGTTAQLKVGFWRVRNYDRYLNEFGIRGALMAHQIVNEPLSEIKQGELKWLAKLVGKPIFVNEEGDRYFPVKSDHIKPIVFTRKGEKIISLPFRIRPNGMEVKIPGNMRTDHFITANFLFRRWFRAEGDDHAQLPIGPDAWGRIAVKNTSNSSLITIHYLPPWHTGMGLGLVLMAFSWGAWRLGRRAAKA